MNAELIRRCVRAMTETGEGSLVPLCRNIVEDERVKGHANLARQLDLIVAKAESKPRTQAMRPLAGGRPTQPGRSAAAVFITRLEQDQLRHDMVLDEAIENRFQRIEKEYLARERLAKYGLQHVRKVLLYGPPGCGKTMGAERLAWSVGLPMLKVKLDTLISSYFGESATNLRTVFEEAHKEPCVLFLDECDFIARRRDGSRDVGEVSRIVNTLLQLMEEYDAPGLLIAATNLDELLDAALFRRFDDVFEIPLPGRPEVVRLLKATLSAMPLDRHVCWDALADHLLGVSAAGIVKIAQDAAKDVILGTETVLRHEDLERAITRAHRHPGKRK
jgi:SpoVK/Ycf46/Vps4 family AAA+-type ATPase